jgi:NADH:ubiquinone oxidoreductase subunit E
LKDRNNIEETFQDIVNSSAKDRENIISVFQSIQETFGYVPEKAVNLVSKRLGVPASRLFSIITFFPQFHLKPTGENIITVCRGSACHVNGSERLLNRILIELGIPPSEDTTEDFKFTVEKVNCVGACSMAPVVLINNEVCGKMAFDKLKKKIAKIRLSE